MKIKNGLGKILITGLLIFLTSIFVYPVLTILNIALKSREAYAQDPLSITTSPSIQNFVKAWNGANMSAFFLNSIFYTLVSSVLLVAVTVFVAYPIARKKIKFHNALYTLITATLILPPSLIPMYTIMKTLKLTNQYHGMIMLYIGTGIPIAVFILTGFVRTIPFELDEAASIDGCGYFRYIFTIVFPLMKSAIATVMMLQALGVWNDFTNPYLFLSDAKMRNLASGLYLFKGEFTLDITVFAAAIVIIVIPITVFYIFMQNQITESLTQGAVKG